MWGRRLGRLGAPKRSTVLVGLAFSLAVATTNFAAPTLARADLVPFRTSAWSGNGQATSCFGCGTFSGTASLCAVPTSPDLGCTATLSGHADICYNEPATTPAMYGTLTLTSAGQTNTFSVSGIGLLGVPSVFAFQGVDTTNTAFATGTMAITDPIGLPCGSSSVNFTFAGTTENMQTTCDRKA